MTITDTERLDWLERHGYVMAFASDWLPSDGDFRWGTLVRVRKNHEVIPALRDAIDAAMQERH